MVTLVHLVEAAIKSYFTSEKAFAIAKLSKVGFQFQSITQEASHIEERQSREGANKLLLTCPTIVKADNFLLCYATKAKILKI